MSRLQTILPFKLEETEKDSQLSSFAGVPLVYELFRKLKLPKLISKYVKVKEAGWQEWELIETIIGLSVAGGEHLEDVNQMLSDKAFSLLVQKKKDEEMEGKKNQQKEFPSPKALERFLKRFHEEQEKPEEVDSWVPEETKALKGLTKVNRTITKKLIELSEIKTATIENDATSVFSFKKQALGTYKGGTGYMPVLGSVAELGLTLGDEFRDGNVAPKFEVEQFFKESLKSIPRSVKKIRTRLDGAYYNHNFIKYLNNPKKEWGVIEFTITGKKSDSFLKWIEAIPDKEWKPLMKVTPQGLVPSGREWTEIHWTSAEGTRKEMRERTLRMLVTRKTQEQWELFQATFKSETEKKDRYEVITTNMDWQGDKLIRWHYERAGSIEHLNDRIKNDLAGGILPCAEFGANAAWWRIQCLTWNLIRALQLHCLPEELKNCHLKKLRFKLFCIAGKVIDHSRYLILKLTRGHPSFQIYRDARLMIAALAVP